MRNNKKLSITKTEKLIKYQFIQIMRAAFCISVFLFHFDTIYFPHGYIGVHLFFCISGFLVAYQTDNKTHRAVAHVFVKRFKNLVPLSIISASIAIVTLFIIAKGQHILINENIESYFSFLFLNLNYYFTEKINYFNPDQFRFILLHFWSLTVEFQALLVFFTLRLLVGEKLQITVGFFAVLSIYLYEYILGLDGNNYFSSSGWFIIFSLGFYSYYITKIKIKLRYFFNFLVLIFIGNCYYLDILISFKWMPEVLIICLVITILTFIREIEKKFSKYFDIKLVYFFILFGNFSFAFYVIHFPVLYFIKELRFSYFNELFFSFSITVILAMITNHLMKKLK